MKPASAPLDLQAATAAYQEAHVIPHCTQCAKPCCRLETLVLDLSWKQVKVFWQIEEARAAFDKRLAAGQGPEEIRESQGRYYIHSKPCPAYDPAKGQCRVYDQPLKPAGCSDFPIYEDGHCIVADLRCEAVDLPRLADAIAQVAGPGYRIIQSADPEFPFLVTLTLRKSGKPPARPAKKQRPAPR